MNKESFVIDRSLPESTLAELKAERKEFMDWHYQNFCETTMGLLSKQVDREPLYIAMFSLPDNMTARENEFKVWQAANRLNKAKRIAMDQPGTVHQMPPYTPICSKYQEPKTEPECAVDPAQGIDINQYLRKYQDGDVLIVCDRDKFSVKMPCGVTAHFINHTHMWSFADLAPYKTAVKQVREIFVDTAFISAVSKVELNGYIDFLIKELKCPANVKQTNVTFGNGIFVEVEPGADHD